MTGTFSETAMKDGMEHPTLGPVYFEAREVADRLMGKFEADNFGPMITKFSDEFKDKLVDYVRYSMLDDVGCNLQNEMWRMVDGTIDALLGGERWAFDRHVLGSHYDHDKVRAAIAHHIPQELQDKRIADLEAEIVNLKLDLEWAHRR